MTKKENIEARALELYPEDKALRIAYIAGFNDAQINSSILKPEQLGYVDLGLSVKWASCNLGAETPEEYGDYYAHDEAMKAVEGKDYRLPTKEELQELIDKCEWKWSDEKSGYTVTGPNGNSIFLPAAGWRYGNSPYSRGSYGLYWSSSLNESYSYCAWYLYFSSGDRGVNDDSRCNGRSVRPVI